MVGRRLFALFLFLLVERSIADVCNSGCTKGGQTGGFVQGNVYKYYFEGKSKVSLSGAERQETGIDLSADVEVYGLGNCANILVLKSLNIKGPNGTMSFDAARIANPVRFVMEDGKISSDICTSPNDSPRILNVKRAVISMLQSSVESGTETDVFGQCPTAINSRKDGNGMIITKTRDLNRCLYREQGKHDILSYKTSRAMTSSNILDASMKVDAVIKNGVVEKADSVENYLYVPFSVGTSGAKSHVTAKIVLKGTSKGANAGRPSVVKSVIFETADVPIDGHSSFNEINYALKQVTQQLTKTVAEDSASLFAGFIRVLRSANKNDIESVYNQIKGGSSVQDNSLSRKVFLDAIFRTGTASSLEFTIGLIKNKQLSKIEQSLAVLSLATVTSVSDETVRAATGLLDLPDMPNEMFLGIGTIAGVYCRTHKCHGSGTQDKNIADLSKKLSAKIGQCKAATKKEQNTIIFALKAIKNIRHIEDSVVGNIAHCASDRNVAPRLRIAALETMIADACIPQLRTSAMTILKDNTEDSEIRIHAYLSTLHCTSIEWANDITKLLENEKINQVGAYVTSSLRNLEASVDPSRAIMKKHASLVKNKRLFPIDPLKYSQNYEASFEDDMFKLGHVVDANIIYSQDSFLPRYTSLNVSTEIFGRSLNLLELSIRQGNMERVLEEFFGPQGEFNSKTPQQVYNTIKNNGMDILETIKQRMEKIRGKRSVLQATGILGRQLKTDIQPYTGDLDLDMSLKVLGSDIMFLSIEENRDHFVDKMINRFFDAIDEKMSNAKDLSHEIRNHMLLLDVEAAYPTSLGVALKLTIEGVSTTKVQFASKIDFKQIFKDPKNSQIDFQVFPSANVQVSGTLMFDAYYMAAGLKVANTLHTSTGSHIVAKLSDNGHFFDLKIGLPLKKQEFVSVKHELRFVSRRNGQLDIETPLKMEDGSDSGWGGCFDQIKEAVSFSICGDVVYPGFLKKNEIQVSNTGTGPLRGPGHFYLYLENNDGLNGFHVTGRYDDKVEGERKFEVTLATEGTKSPRKIVFKGDLISKPDLGSVKMVFNSNPTNAEFEATVKNDAKEKSALLRVKYNEDEYMGKIGATVSGARNVQTYKPILEIKFGGAKQQIVEVDGTITKEMTNSRNKYTAKNISFKLKDKDAFKLQGTWTTDNNYFDVDLKMNQKDQSGTIKGKYTGTPPKTHVDLEVTTTFSPNSNFALNWDYIDDEGKHFKQVDFWIIHGQNLKSNENKVTYHAELKGDTKAEFKDMNVEYKNKLTYPLMKVNFETEIEVKPKKSKVELKGSFNDKSGEFKSELQRGMKNEKDLAGKLKIKVNNQGFESEAKFEAVEEKKTKYETKLTIFPSDKYEASGVVIYRVADNDVDVGFSCNVVLAGRKEPYKYETGYVNNPKLFNAFTKASVGKEDWVDAMIKIQKGNAPSGNMKLFAKDFVKGDGNFKVNAVDHKGNALVNVEFLKSKRKVKLDGNMMINNPQYNMDLNIFYDFGKDNSKKLTFTTVSKVAKNNIDSKNTFTCPDHKLDYNIKGTYDQDKANIQTALSNSNGKSLTANWDINKNIEKGGHWNVAVSYVANAGEKPYKFTRKSTLSKSQYTDQLTYTNNKNEEFNVQFDGKKSEKGKSVFLVGKVTMNGALAPNTLTADIELEAQEKKDEKDTTMLNTVFKGSYGPKTTWSTSAKYILTDNDINTEGDLTLNFPLDKPQSLKIRSKSYMLTDDTDNFNVKDFLDITFNDERYSHDFEFKEIETDDKENGFVKLTMSIPNQKKFTWNGNFDQYKKDDRTFYKANTDVEYGDKQKASLNVEGNGIFDKDVVAKIVVAFPSNYKGAKRAQVDYKYNSPTADSMNAETKVDIDGKKYVTNINIDSTPESPVLDIKGTWHDKKPFTIFGRGNFVDKNSIDAEAKFENVGDFDLDFNMNAQCKDNDDFSVKLYVDSAKLKANKVQVEASSESVGADKKITLKSQEAGKNLLSGSATYRSRNEGNKYIIEGSGNMKVKEQNKPLSFKYIKDKISTGNERGDDVHFSIKLGEKNGAFEYKQTNNVQRFYTAYCEDKSDCAHVTLFEKIESTEDSFNDEFQLSIDLRKLGFVPEFGVTRQTTLKPKVLPVHTFNMHLNLEKSKYNTEFHLKPNNGKYESVFTVNMPHRIVSLESSTTLLDEKKPVFPIVHETVLYTNKQVDPHAKSVFKVTFGREQKNAETKMTTDVILTSPALSKPFEINGRSTVNTETKQGSFDCTFDIFSKKTQRLVVNGKFNPKYSKEEFQYNAELIVNGKSLGFEALFSENLFINKQKFNLNSKASLTLDGKVKETSAVVELDSKKANVQIRTPSGELVNYVGTLDTSKQGAIQTQETMSLFGGKKYIRNIDAYYKPNIGFSVTLKEAGKGDSATVSGQIKIGDFYELGANFIEGGKKKPLAHISGKVAGNKIKPEQEVNSENVKQFGERIRSEVEQQFKRFEETNKNIADLVQEDSKKVAEIFKKNGYDFQGARKYFETEFNNIRTEIESDKTLQKHMKPVNDWLKSAMEALKDIVDKSMEIAENNAKLTREVIDKFTDAMDKHVIKEVTIFYEKISKAFMTVAQAVVDVMTHYVAVVATYVEKHMADLQPLFENALTLFNDFMKKTEEKMKKFGQELEKLAKELKEQIQNNDFMNFLQEKIADLNIAENLKELIKQARESVIAFLPSAFTDFDEKLYKYVERKLSNDKGVDDAEELKTIFFAWLAALESLRQDWKLSELGITAPTINSIINPLGQRYAQTLPGFSLPKSSLVNQLLEDDDDINEDELRNMALKSLRDFFGGSRAYSISGVLAGGQHIFTFDGRHLTFPGDCKYVLAQDAVDGNFSIVMTMEKGNPKAVTLVDKSGSEVEYRLGGQLLYGDKPHGFPVMKSHVVAWKESHSFTLKTNYGALINCGFDLKLCSVQVSGFYMGKLRGLLGNGNNEPYDDFKLPSGVIARNEAEFGNAYGLGSCPKVNTVDHGHHHGHSGDEGICNNFFSTKSRLAPCNVAVDISIYRQACQHATMNMKPNDKKTTKEACMIARAYKKACKNNMWFVPMPQDCVVCEYDKPYETKDYKFEMPKKQADIFVAVETTKVNEKYFKEIAVPLVNQLLNELKAKKIDDVKVIVAGVSPKMQWPIYYDIQGNKIQSAKIEFTDELRSTNWESPITTGNEKVDEWLANIAGISHTFAYNLGIPLRRTYSLIAQYEARPSAVKTLIAVNSEPCHFYSIPLVSNAFARMFENYGWNVHIISPRGVNKDQQAEDKTGAIGYSENHVFMMSDKKRGLSNSNKRSSLAATQDACSDMALRTHGNVYTSSPFNGMDAGKKKTYISLLSNTIVDAIASVTRELKCKCTGINVFNDSPNMLCFLEKIKDNRKAGSKK